MSAAPQITPAGDSGNGGRRRKPPVQPSLVRRLLRARAELEMYESLDQVPAASRAVTPGEVARLLTAVRTVRSARTFREHVYAIALCCDVADDLEGAAPHDLLADLRALTPQAQAATTRRRGR